MVGLAFGVTSPVEVIALLMRDDHQADADTHGREEEHEGPAFEGRRMSGGGAGEGGRPLPLCRLDAWNGDNKDASAEDCARLIAHETGRHSVGHPLAGDCLA